jgi:hypothetical protein
MTNLLTAWISGKADGLDNFLHLWSLNKIFIFIVASYAIKLK